VRVYELAKDLGIGTKELMELLGRMKVAVKSHSSSLDEATVRRVREHVAAHGTRMPQPPPPPARPAVTTPAGERILSIRKITPPPPPPVPEPPPPEGRPAEVPEAAAPSTAPAVPSVEPTPREAPREVPAERPAARASAAPAAPAPAAPAVPPAQAPAAPAPPKVPAPGRAEPIRITPVKPPPREAAREVLTPEEVARELFGPVPPAPSEAPPKPPEVPVPPRPEAPRRPERRLPPPPPPRRFHTERRGRRPEPRVAEPVEAAAPVAPSEVELAGPIGVGELAARLHLPVADVVRRLLELGVLAGVNQQLPMDVAARVVESFGSTVVRPREATEAPAAAARPRPAATDPEAVPRAPVVTVMGHVDHGKTTLLDAIRATHVAEQEVGGITQHIGASTADVDGRRVVFIDTPGHEAFTALRARGAQVTDIAVLVVAADDGVMPQTVEAINHARAAGVPIIVAINKMDLPQANLDRVKQQLAELGLVPEEWGGDTVMVPVSARQRTGLRELLEMILLVADLHDLRANPRKPARGTVLEARLDRGRGPVATVLVQEGTLRVGDAIVAGEVAGRVRALLDERGQRVREAGPSTAVEVLGLEAVPTAGDLLEVVRDERLAKALAEERRERRRAAETAARPGVVEELTAEGRRELRLILKADVHGSVEALQGALARLEVPEVRLTILHTGVGTITESDVMLAAASRAVIVGFNVRPDPAVRKLAEQEQVEIRLYRIIYEALEDIEQRLRGLMAPRVEEVVLGRAEVRATFAIPRVGTVAGCYVATGRMVRGAQVRLLRDGAVVYEGRIASLRRFKEDVREVPEGFECGIGLERFQDVKVGDVIETYEVREVPAA
jgi:translation initiation factor IF-2